MKTLKNYLKSLWKDEAAQGATEYILLLLVVVAIAFLFKEQIKGAVDTKLKDLSLQIGNFSGN